MAGMAEIRELDACSIVPSIWETDPYEVLAQDLYNENPNRWQRSLDRVRTAKIGEFWREIEPIGSAENGETKRGHIVNNIVLGLSKEEHEEYPEEPGYFCINLGESWFEHTCAHCATLITTILQEKGEEVGRESVYEQIKSYQDQLERGDVDFSNWKVYADHCPDSSCPQHQGSQGISNAGLKRPLEIIDGQHRTRGLNHFENSELENSEGYGRCSYGRTEHEFDEEKCIEECGPGHWMALKPPTRELIPFSITEFSDDVNNRAVKARIFVDINTRAKGLTPNHKLTMLYRHNVKDGYIDDEKWKTDVLDFSNHNNEESLVYRLILELGRVAGGHQQTSGRIPPLIAIEDASELISVRKLRVYIKKWREVDQVFAGYQASGQTQQVAEVFNNYLKAWAWHFSGPIDNANPLPRGWTPSHTDYRMGNPSWDAAGLDAKSKQDMGGYIPTPETQTTPEEKQLGEVIESPLLKLVLKLFSPISVNILKDLFVHEENENWSDAQLQGAYTATPARLTEAAFRLQIQKLVDDGIKFDRKPLTKGGLNNAEDEFVLQLKKQYGW
jgi:hypothetical protein